MPRRPETLSDLTPRTRAFITWWRGQDPATQRATRDCLILQKHGVIDIPAGAMIAWIERRAVRYHRVGSPLPEPAKVIPFPRAP